MPGMRFMSIGNEAKVIEARLDGQFQLIRSGEEWFVTARIEKDEYNLGRYDEHTARKVVAYAGAKPEQARHAARKLYLEADDGPLEAFVTAALNYDDKRPRNVRVTIEIQVDMPGDDKDVEDYVRTKLAYAVRIKKVHSVTVKEGLGENKTID